MPMLKLALITGACASLCVSWASWSAGYPPEIAITRGVIGFMAISLLGFCAELVATRARPTPPQHAAPRHEPVEQIESL